MKRAYEKPALYIERFTLTQTIAHNCGDNLDFSMGTAKTKESCGWQVGTTEIFMDPNICEFPTEYFGGVCYNAPDGGYNVFNS